MSQQPGIRSVDITQQLHQLVGQYRHEMEQARRLGNDTTEGAAHLQRANSIRDLLQRYQSQTAQGNRQRAATANAQNSNPQHAVSGDNRQMRMNQRGPMPQVGPGGVPMRQMPGVAHGGPQGGPQQAGQVGAARAQNQMPQFENTAAQQRQMAQQQMLAQQNQQNAVAGLQTYQALQQRQQFIHDLKQQQAEMSRRLEQIEAALRNPNTPQAEAERLQESHQAIQKRLEMYRQREQVVGHEIRTAMRQNPQLVRQATAAQQQQQQQRQQQQQQRQGVPAQQAAQQMPTQQGQRQPADQQSMNIAGSPQVGMAMPAGQNQGMAQRGQVAQAGAPANQRVPMAGSQNAAGMRAQQTAPPAPGGTPGASANAAPGAAGQSADVSGPVTRRMAAMSGSGGRANSLTVPHTLNVAQPAPVNVRPGRPTLLNGGASSAMALNSPALARIPGFEVTGDRVLSKRKLSELVSGVLGEDNSAAIDGDVEELLYDLADEFVTSVTSFACKIAKHRHSDTLEAKDVQLHLERNWNMRIPGFSADEVRSVRKIQPVSSYQQKLSAINMNRGSQK